MEDIPSLREQLRNTTDKKKKRELYTKISILERKNTPTKNDIKVEEVEEVEDVKYLNLKKKKEEKLFNKKESQRILREEALRMGKDIIPYKDNELNILLPLFLNDNLFLKEIKADGNCLFTSIFEQLPPNSGILMVKDLRILVVKHLRMEKNFYSPFIDEDYEEYCINLENGHSWGGHLEIEIISKLLGLQIIIYQMIEPQKIVFNYGNVVIRICYRKHAYSLGEHYDSLIKGDVGLE